MPANVEVVVDVAEWFISYRITPHNFLYRSRQDQSSVADYLILTDMIMIQLSAVSIKCFMKVFRVNLSAFLALLEALHPTPVSHKLGGGSVVVSNLRRFVC